MIEELLVLGKSIEYDPSKVYREVLRAPPGVSAHLTYRLSPKELEEDAKDLDTKFIKRLEGKLEDLYWDLVEGKFHHVYPGYGSEEEIGKVKRWHINGLENTIALYTSVLDVFDSKHSEKYWAKRYENLQKDLKVKTLISKDTKRFKEFDPNYQRTLKILTGGYNFERLEQLLIVCTGPYSIDQIVRNKSETIVKLEMLKRAGLLEREGNTYFITSNGKRYIKEFGMDKEAEELRNSLVQLKVGVN